MEERLYDILISPIYSEKSTMHSQYSKYVFKVAKTADKDSVKRALKKIFNVDVLKVNIINTKPKTKVFKGVSGARNAYKKAIVTAEKGKVFEFISGV